MEELLEKGIIYLVMALGALIFGLILDVLAANDKTGEKR